MTTPNETKPLIAQSLLTDVLEREQFEKVCRRYVYTTDFSRSLGNRENYYVLEVQAYWQFWKEARSNKLA